MTARIAATAEELLAAINLFDGGTSYVLAAKQLNRNHSTVKNWQRQYNNGQLQVRDGQVYFRGELIEPNRGGLVAEDAKEPPRKIRELEQRIADLLTQLEDARKPRVTYEPHQAPPQKGSFKRVVIPDSHGCKADPKAIAAFLADLERVGDVREVVFLGDHLDCDGFLTTHVPQYIPRSNYSYEEDIAATNEFLDAVQARCPNAKYYYLEGNHEWRVEKWIVKALQNEIKDAEFLYRRIGPASVLSLEKRGIDFFRHGDQHMGLSIRGTIKLGPCYFMHGSTTNSKTASYTNLRKYADLLVHGHNHQQQQASGHFMDGSSKAVWCPGCLSELNPIWAHSDPCSWTHGYGLQCVNPDLTFHHINVPLIDGKSLLGHFQWN